MLKPSFRTIYIICLVIVCLLIAFSAYLQFWRDVLLPCPLTYIERVLMSILGVTFLASALYNHTNLSRKLWSWLAFAISLAGAFTAGRHGWLQRFNFEQTNNSHGLFGFSLQQFPILQPLQAAYNSQLCAPVQWKIFELSTADWFLIFFILFAIVCLWQQSRKI